MISPPFTAVWCSAGPRWIHFEMFEAGTRLPIFPLLILPSSLAAGADYSAQTYSHSPYTSYGDAWRFTNSSILSQLLFLLLFVDTVQHVVPLMKVFRCHNDFQSRHLHKYKRKGNNKQSHGS